MKKIFALAVSFIIGSSALAAGSDYGIAAGFRSQSGEIDSTTQTTSAAAGYQVGAVASFEISGALNFRTGLMYVERPLKVNITSSGESADIKITYFDIPATLAYKFAEYASVYGGVHLAANLSNSVSGPGYAGKLTDVKSMVVPITIGAVFRFAPQIGADLFFETMSGDVALGLKNYRAVGANLLYFFD